MQKVWKIFVYNFVDSDADKYYCSKYAIAISPQSGDTIPGQS